MRSTALLGMLLFAAACGPISPERAAAQCAERARAAAGPTGKIGIGVNSEKGLITTGEVRITTDYLSGRDPNIVYEQCVRQKTGQAPIRPLVL